MTRLLSNLQLGAFIGRGHFGQVYQGVDDIHGDVAIKVFSQEPGELDTDWAIRKAELLAEGQKLKQAKHANVVDVHHLVASEAGDAVLLVMELCRGGSLQAKFNAGPMSLADLKRAATDLALGLQALHARGMLHRDLKPGNLLIDSTGRAKLGDFGLVTDRIVMGYGSAAGYLDHLAIEVHLGGPTSVKTDFWAFGMTIYRLIHGAVWYAKSPPPAAIIPAGGFSGRLSWLPHVPDAWRRFIRKCLHDDPNSRFQTVGEMMNAMASLPTDPDWQCQVSGTSVSWSRETTQRLIRAQWTEHSAKIHEWSAWSEPRNGVGRPYTLASTNGQVRHTEAMKAMRQFFV